MQRVRRSSRCAAALCLLVGIGVPAFHAVAQGIDARQHGFRISDAHRFALMFPAHSQPPDVQALQSGYLDGATPAVGMMLRHEGVDAAALAMAIERDPQRYRATVDTCMPWLDTLQPTYDSVAQGWQRLQPGRPTPPIHLLFGAGTSAGTGVPGEGVALDLSRICEGMEDATALQARVRVLAAHEVAHAWQPIWPEDDPTRRDLLLWALREGGASLLGALANGTDPTPVTPTWARGREHALLQGFMADRTLMLQQWQPGTEPGAEVIAAGTRWFWNAPAEDGRPADLGYWIGHSIAWAWYRRQDDPRAAVQQLLALEDVDGIVQESGLLPDG